MSDCPYCGSDTFYPEAVEVETEQGVGWVNRCKSCEKRSVYEESDGQQYKAEDYPDGTVNDSP